MNPLYIHPVYKLQLYSEHCITEFDQTSSPTPSPLFTSFLVNRQAECRHSLPSSCLHELSSPAFPRKSFAHSFSIPKKCSLFSFRNRAELQSVSSNATTEHFTSSKTAYVQPVEADLFSTRPGTTKRLQIETEKAEQEANVYRYPLMSVNY